MIQFNQTYSINDGQESIVFTEGKGNTISGKYNAGNLTGSLVGNLLKATYHNHKNNGAGLIEIEFTEKGFIAKWKQGLEPGPMRGKWKGVLKAETRKEEKIKVDIASEALTDEQKQYIEQGIRSWDFEGDEEEAKEKKRWLSNRSFLIEALRQDGQCIQYSPDELKSDREIVLEAIKKDGRALEFASESIKADREIVLQAVKNDVKALEFASESIKADREIVLQAVKNDGTALKFASDTIKADLEIILEAVKNDGSALEFVSDQMNDYAEAVLFALRKESYAARYIRNEDVLHELATNGSVKEEKVPFKVRDLVGGVKKYFQEKIYEKEENEVVSELAEKWFDFNQIIYKNHPMDGDALLSLAQVMFDDYTPTPTDGRKKEEYTESLLIQAIELNDSSLWDTIEYGLIQEEYTDFTYLAEKACSLYWNRSVKDYVTALSILLNDNSGELREGLGDEFVANIIKEARENNKGEEEDKESFEDFVSEAGLE